MKNKPKITLEAVFDDAAAKQAYASLIRMNADKDQLWIHLQCAVDAYFLPHSWDVLFVDGMTRKQVSLFPDRLRSIAREIEQLEENPHLESTGEMESIARSLPALLQRYATAQQGNIRLIRSVMKANPRYFYMQSIFKRKLLRYVHQTTGHPRFSLVADLLNGALSAAGLTDTKLTSPGSLRNLYRRKENLRLPA